MLTQLGHCVYYSPDQALGDMQENIDDAETAIEEGNLSVALGLLAKLREDVDTLKAQVDDIRGQGAGYAPLEHGHELPEPLRGLAEDLKAAEAQEVSPKITHKRYRPVFGHG